MGYNVILADPPWKYKTDMVTGHKSLDHYPSMSNDELKNMDVRGACDDQCVLFMWTTTPNLDVAIEVGRAWGFDYKQVAFVWDKVNPCNGNYTLPQVELVLVFRPKKGKLPKRSKTNVRQVIVEKKREHSRKPEYVQDMIDLMYPDAKNSNCSLDGRDPDGTCGVMRLLNLTRRKHEEYQISVQRTEANPREYGLRQSDSDLHELLQEMGVQLHRRIDAKSRAPVPVYRQTLPQGNASGYAVQVGVGTYS